MEKNLPFLVLSYITIPPHLMQLSLPTIICPTTDPTHLCPWYSEVEEFNWGLAQTNGSGNFHTLHVTQGLGKERHRLKKITFQSLKNFIILQLLLHVGIEESKKPRFKALPGEESQWQMGSLQKDRGPGLQHTHTCIHVYLPEVKIKWWNLRNRSNSRIFSQKIRFQISMDQI